MYRSRRASSNGSSHCSHLSGSGFFSFLISHFSFLISHFSFLISLLSVSVSLFALSSTGLLREAPRPHILRSQLASTPAAPSVDDLRTTNAPTPSSCSDSEEFARPRSVSDSLPASRPHRLPDFAQPLIAPPGGDPPEDAGQSTRRTLVGPGPRHAVCGWAVAALVWPLCILLACVTDLSSRWSGFGGIPSRLPHFRMVYGSLGY